MATKKRSLNQFDHAVIRHVKKKGKTFEGIFAELVNMISYGNIDYVNYLMKEFGHRNDMGKLARSLYTFR
jgi:hypothetical protein